MAFYENDFKTNPFNEGWDQAVGGEGSLAYLSSDDEIRSIADSYYSSFYDRVYTSRIQYGNDILNGSLEYGYDIEIRGDTSQTDDLSYADIMLMGDDVFWSNMSNGYYLRNSVDDVSNQNIYYLYRRKGGDDTKLDQTGFIGSDGQQLYDIKRIKANLVESGGEYSFEIVGIDIDNAEQFRIETTDTPSFNNPSSYTNFGIHHYNKYGGVVGNKTYVYFSSLTIEEGNVFIDLRRKLEGPNRRKSQDNTRRKNNENRRKSDDDNRRNITD